MRKWFIIGLLFLLSLVVIGAAPPWVAPLSGGACTPGEQWACSNFAVLHDYLTAMDVTVAGKQTGPLTGPVSASVGSGATSLAGAASLDANGAIDVPFIATLTGDANIVVSGAGTVGRPVTLALGTPVTLDADPHPKVLTSATNTAIATLNAAGEVVASTATLSAGTLNTGGIGPSCWGGRNAEDTGNFDCEFSGGAWGCLPDTNGTRCDGI